MNPSRPREYWSRLKRNEKKWKSSNESSLSLSIVGRIKIFLQLIDWIFLNSFYTKFIRWIECNVEPKALNSVKRFSMQFEIRLQFSSLYQVQRRAGQMTVAKLSHSHLRTQSTRIIEHQTNINEFKISKVVENECENVSSFAKYLFFSFWIVHPVI